MGIEDLEVAKKRLRIYGLTLSIVKDSKAVFESKSKGISDLVRAIESLGDKLSGASAADRVVGKAAALLFVYVGVRAVYAHILSSRAKTVLENNEVYFEWDGLVDKILNSKMDEACPFEKMAENISSPEEAYRRIKDRLML
ncbi:MAG: DUF1893 domain-containing protein [Candidatus Bathyarchaeia archaeon]